MNKKIQCSLSAVMFAAVCASVPADLVRFDINDRGSGSPTLSGWTGVVGASDNSDTITGTDGTHTLTLSSSGDGQDRDRGTGGFVADADMWRDFWFAAGSRTGGDTATATISGLEPSTFYSVQIWGFDNASTGARVVVWTDAVSGNTGTSSFNGGTTPSPTSLGQYVATIPSRTDESGTLVLTGAGGSGGSGANPNIFVNGLSVSDLSDTSSLPTAEAESGTLGSGFSATTINGTSCITISPSGGGTSPGAAARVATYTLQFPKADTYQLFARIYTGPEAYSDDSLFYATGFGQKSATNSSDWITLNGLVDGGFTGASDVVTVGGGAAGGQVWKWIKLGTLYTVSDGDLIKTFQIGGREDGLYVDKLAFGPADISLTVADLDSGVIPTPNLSPNVFEGPDGIAISRFDERLQGINLDGANPAGGLVMIGDALYGTTLNGGLQGDGTIYRVSLDGTGFEVVRTLSSGANAANPQGGLAASGGGFIGASLTGGANGTGALFTGQGDGSLSLIHSFNALSPHTAANFGGACPSPSLALSVNKIYGVASSGGANANGTIYSISTNGSGFTVLHDFDALEARTGTNTDGALPYGGVIVSGTKLYGTTSSGGAGGAGVVFSIETSGGNYTVLHSFAPLDPLTGTNLDGASPVGGLVLANGVLYGTTISGGTGGKGTVFSIGTGGLGFAVLHDFPATDALTGTNEQGASPGAGLILSGNILYGTASAGGTGATGTVFSLDITGPVFDTVHHFEAVAGDGTNAYGAFPVAPVLRVGNSLYGPAFGGGPGGAGTVFRITIPVKTSLSARNNVGGGIDMIFTGTGAPDSIYTIQGTDELGSTPTIWQNLSTVVSDASGTWQFEEQGQTAPKRFYRVTFDR